MLSYGNKKLGDNLAIFSISAGKNGSCRQDCENCFALKIEKLRPAVALSRRRNFILAQSKEFADLMIREIKQSRCVFDTMRVHEGGEFFSQAYIGAWVKIVESFKKILFFAYTDLDPTLYNFRDLREQKNFVLISSRKTRNGKKNYADRETLIKEGLESRICPLKKGEFCGVHCRYCMTKTAADLPPVFVRH